MIVAIFIDTINQKLHYYNTKIKIIVSLKDFDIWLNVEGLKNQARVDLSLRNSFKLMELSNFLTITKLIVSYSDSRSVEVMDIRFSSLMVSMILTNLNLNWSFSGSKLVNLTVAN